MEENLTEKFDQCCQKAGLKRTPQRFVVYKTLVESDDHPSAEEVYSLVKADIPNISLDTVNRTLHTLAQIGAASIVEGSSQVRRYDGHVGDHQHFKCTVCNRIIDFHDDMLENIAIPKFISENYEVHRKTVFFEGVCDKCKQ
jgi:Fe2+ or Zn2+ uptake regulation protein